MKEKKATLDNIFWKNYLNEKKKKKENGFLKKLQFFFFCTVALS